MLFYEKPQDCQRFLHGICPGLFIIGRQFLLDLHPGISGRVNPETVYTAGVAKIDIGAVLFQNCTADFRFHFFGRLFRYRRIQICLGPGSADLQIRLQNTSGGDGEVTVPGLQEIQQQLFRPAGRLPVLPDS